MEFLSNRKINRTLSSWLCLDQSGDCKETIIANITGNVRLKYNRMVQYKPSCGYKILKQGVQRMEC